MSDTSKTNNEIDPILAQIEEAGFSLPRHKRKQLTAVLLDTSAPPPTRGQLDNFGNSLDKLGQQVQGIMDQIVELRKSCEEEPGKLMRARRERLMFSLSVIKRVEPNMIPRSSTDLAQEAALHPDSPQNPMQPDPVVAKVRAVAGGILDAFMRGEEEKISDEPSSQQQRDQISMGIDLLTSIPDSHRGGDTYCDIVRERACKTILGYLDPEAGAYEAAWNAEAARAS